MPNNERMKTDSDIIEELGGTAAVARLCEVQMPSVSEWRASGIPKARLMYLKAIRPDVFKGSEHDSGLKNAVVSESVVA